MKKVDLNLLSALDALLREGSVTGAARRLGLSFSAMSRTLSRLREATGDPLLVRAGRGLVPTPHAMALRDRVCLLNEETHAVLRPAAKAVEAAALDLTFTIRAGGGFVDMLSAAVVEAIHQEAPRVFLRFLHKGDGDALPLREGPVDLEISQRGTTAPEMRRQFLFRDRYVGVARKGHAVAGSGKMTAKRFAACKHVASSHFGAALEPIDHALGEIGLSRAIQVEVPGYPDAMRVAAHSELLAIVPQSCLGNAFLKGYAASLGLCSFELPVSLPAMQIAALWHPRIDADPAQRWLRQVVASVCRKAYPES
jgi:DNA-binding transcriptional LysR family regulator